VLLASTDPTVFSSGADLDLGNEERAAVSDQLYALYELMVTFPVPIVAVVEGPAVGGGAQLAVAADVRVAGSDARLRFPGTGHGLSVGGWALPGLVGRGRALELCLSRRWVDASEAERIGLVQAISKNPMDWALAFAQRVLASDGQAVRRLKESVNGDRLVAALRAERDGNAAGWSGSTAGLTREEPPSVG
jgi:enoyl-CoA hydratase